MKSAKIVKQIRDISKELAEREAPLALALSVTADELESLDNESKFKVGDEAWYVTPTNLLIRCKILKIVGFYCKLDEPTLIGIHFDILYKTKEDAVNQLKISSNLHFNRNGTLDEWRQLQISSPNYQCVDKQHKIDWFNLNDLVGELNV